MEKRTRKRICRVLAIALFYVAGACGAAEAYVDSVPLPGRPPGPQASTLYYSDGTTILARVGTADHSDVPLSTVPLTVRRAVLAAEDREFYEHAAVSPRGIARAVVANTGGDGQGGSTITQQYARNAYLSQERTFERKSKELALAVKLERQYSKDQILEKYLNTIYFGRGAYGIAAAANAYFGATPDRLTLEQGAVLAAVIKDPWNFDPSVNDRDAGWRWGWILKGMFQKGWIDNATLIGAHLPETRPRNSTAEAIGGPNGLVVDRVERELIAHGVTAQELHTQGLSVVTTIDRPAQDAALKTVADNLAGQPKELRAALVAIDPATGAVRAYYGGDKGSGYFDDATAPRPPASTFKPIALAAGLQQGIGFLSRWDGSSPRVFPDRNGAPLNNHDDLQCPDCTLQQAMVDSLNTPFYALTQQIGADKVRAAAIALGIPEQYGDQPSLVDVKGDPAPGKTRSDIAIGRYPVAPADLASVYATFAAGGVRSERYFVESAKDADGSPLWTASPQHRRALPAAVAADVSTVLTSVVDSHGALPGRVTAGKTGSQQWANTKDSQDAWMAGYTPQLATAVWLGRAVPGPIRDSKGGAINGETVPMTVWRSFLEQALSGKPAAPFPAAAHVGRIDTGDAGRSHDPDQAANNHPAQGGQPVVHTAHTGRYLALTFDDGPSSFTPAILDLLKQYHVKATFCLVGEQVEQYESVVRRMVAEGHALCNHSTHHDDLGAAGETAVHNDIQTTDTAIAKALLPGLPGSTITYFRAPYGDWGASSKVGAQLGHTPLGWLVDPDDWALPGVDQIVSRVRSQLTDRAVVLVHDGGGERQQTIDALKILIPELKGKGWQFDLPETTVQPHSLTVNPPSSPTPARSEPLRPAKPTTAPSATGNAKPNTVPGRGAAD